MGGGGSAGAASGGLASAYRVLLVELLLGSVFPMSEKRQWLGSSEILS